MKCLLVLMAIILAGCATSSVPVSKARPVPESRVLTTLWLSQKPNTGLLIIKRDRGFMGSACNIRVYLDGKPVADISTSEKIQLYPPAGDHIVSAKPKGVCGGGMSEASVIIKTGARKIMRVASGQGGDILLQPSAF